jgi:acyl carrier protein
MMQEIKSYDVKKAIHEFLANNSTYGKEVLTKLTDDIDLFNSGLINSIGYIELISSLEKQFAVEFDFENTNPEEYATVRGIVDYIAAGRKNEAAPN